MLLNKRFFIKYIVTFLDLSVSCQLNIATFLDLFIGTIETQSSFCSKKYLKLIEENTKKNSRTNSGLFSSHHMGVNLQLLNNTIA